jgi:hypothetical protein
VPRYVPETHGILVGNNLIKAYFDSGRFVEARATLERLFKLNRPDWKSSLTYWDGMLTQAETSRSVQVAPDGRDGDVRDRGPVWAHAQSPVAKLFRRRP